MKPRLAASTCLLFAVAWLLWAAPSKLFHAQGQAELASRLRRVNVPYTPATDRIPIPPRAIFWFGRVDRTSNYTDVRVIYGDDALYVTLHIFDRLLWYDTTPQPDDLASWDAISLLLNLHGKTGEAPSPDSHRFVAQLGTTPAREGYQAAYQGNGSTWVRAGTEFLSEAAWRGDGLNNGSSARGWIITFTIPFSSLGLAAPPATGTVWGFALEVHDRDDEAGSPIPIQKWPEALDPDVPSTWGEMRFGMPAYTPPATRPVGTTTIRHGLDGATVVDGHVGGHSDCGERYGPNYFDTWGNANYAGYEQVNVQNQWDVADWPCFSKFYLRFPLDLLPRGKTVISATLTLHQFGNSAPDQAAASEIQVLTVDGSWDESTLTWNNAPLAEQNVSSARVEPLAEFPGWPGVPRAWDVSLAVAQAYGRSEDLDLVLYSADGAYHSGKYFSSSDAGDWNQTARPTLEVSWGDPIELAPSQYLPLIVSTSSGGSHLRAGAGGLSRDGSAYGSRMETTQVSSDR